MRKSVKSALFKGPGGVLAVFAKGRALGSVGLLVALQALFAAVVVAAVWIATEHLRVVALEHAQSHAQVQTHNLEDWLTQSFDLLELHLRSMTTEQPLLFETEYGLQDALVALQRKLPYIRSISAIDGQRRVVLSTNPLTIGRRLDLEPLLPRVAVQTPYILRFGAPWVGRDFADGLPFATQPAQSGKEAYFDSGFFPITMVLPDKPDWTLVLAINSDYFINLALNHQGSNPMRQRVFTDEGILLFSTRPSDQPGKFLPHKAHFDHMHRQQIGTARWQGSDGDTALVAFRASSMYPLIVASNTSAQQVLERWRKNTQALYLGVAGVLGLLLLCTGYLTWRVHQAAKREQLLQEENRLAASVFSNSSDLIVIIDAQRRIVTINPAFAQGFGVCLQEVQGRKPEALPQKAEMVQAIRKIWGRLENQNHWEGEFSYVRGDASVLTSWMKVHAVRAEAGQVEHYVAVLQDLSRIRADEDTIRKLSQAVEQSPTAVVITSTQAKIEYVNPEFCRSTGYTKEEAIGRNPRILQSGKTCFSTYREMWDSLQAGNVWRGEFINRRKDGSLYVEAAVVAPMYNATGDVTHYMAIKQDISAEKEAQKNQRLAASVIANTHEGVIICDEFGSIMEVNPAFTRLTGYSREEALGQTPDFLAVGDRLEAQTQALWQGVRSQGYWQGELWNRHKNGGVYVIQAAINAVKDELGEVSHFVSVFSDITELKDREKDLESKAHFDALTGLPNRLLLAQRLQQAMLQAERRQQTLALCFVDLDGFKAVNDTHGHDAGDELLITIAQRLQAKIRSNDLVARLGGDEFVVLLSAAQEEAAYLQTAQRLLDAIAQPVVVAGQHTVHVSGSMGIALYPQDTLEAESLQHYADLAMYRAKQAGRNCYVLFRPEMALEADQAKAGRQVQLRSS